MREERRVVLWMAVGLQLVGTLAILGALLSSFEVGPLSGDAVGPWVFAALLALVSSAWPLSRWFAAQTRFLESVTGVPVQAHGRGRLLLWPVPGGLMGSHVFAVQVAAAREVVGIRGPGPMALAIAIALAPFVGYPLLARELDRIEAAPAP